MVKHPQPASKEFSGRVSETGDFGVPHDGKKRRRETVSVHSPGHRDAADAALHDAVKKDARSGPAYRPARTRDATR